jgi:hypothetical protein
MSHLTIYLDHHGTLEPLMSPAFAQAQPADDSRRCYRWLTPFVIPAWCDWYVEITFSGTDNAIGGGPVDASQQIVLQGYQLK